MRFARFDHGGATRFGIIEGPSVRPFPAHVATLQAYLALDAGERAALATEDAVAIQHIKLLAPVRPQKNVFCVGRNYMGHAEEIARSRGVPLTLPPVPTFFTKAPTSIADPGATLHLLAGLSAQYDWEAELAVVIGVRARDVPEADALATIFGYTALNDVTARDLQKSTVNGSKARASTTPVRSGRGSFRPTRSATRKPSTSRFASTAKRNKRPTRVR